MVDLCPVVKWPGIQMAWYSNGGLKTRLKKPDYGPKCPVFEWSDKSRDFTIWIPDTHTVWYSDESVIQVFSIQMATVVLFSSCPWFWKLFCFGLAGRVLSVLTCLRQQRQKIGEKFGHLVSLALADFLLVRGAWPLFSLLVNPVLPELHCRVEIDLGKLGAKSLRCSRLRLTSLKQRNKIG